MTIRIDRRTVGGLEKYSELDRIGFTKGSAGAILQGVRRRLKAHQVGQG